MLVEPSRTCRKRNDVQGQCRVHWCACLVAAVVAAPGGDDLLHALHGAAVAHQPWMVLQPELLLAWAHAYAGDSSVMMS